ncbi:MAG: hypothetical protein ACM3X3_03995 [Betaproteobacteria bacterium]
MESVREVAAVQGDMVEVEGRLEAGGREGRVQETLAASPVPASPDLGLEAGVEAAAGTAVEVEVDTGVEARTAEGARGANQGRRQRRKRHIFTEYEDKLLMKVLERRPGERKQELERLASLFGVPYLTLRHRFYTVIKRKVSEGPTGPTTVTEVMERAEEAVTARPSQQPQEAGEGRARPALDPMEELLTLPGRVERIEKRLSGMLDLKGFIDRLIDINRQLDREQQLLEELAQKERELQRMREEMQKKVQRINEREEELNDLYSQLEMTLHQFMNLSSIDKLKVLGDFTVKVETVIDRFGNVIRRRPVVVP